MPLLVTTVLPFLAHNHPLAAAFLTCRRKNFHASIIPEFLSDEERVKSFCEARQQNQLEADYRRQCANVYNLFVQTPLMQFSPSLTLRRADCFESILKPLLATKYFTRTLQRCSFGSEVRIHYGLLQSLSKVRSLIKLDLGENDVENHHLEIIVNSFPSLETLTIQNANRLEIVDPSQPTMANMLPPPPSTKTLRSLTLYNVDPLFASRFLLYFPNLRKLVLSAQTEFHGRMLRTTQELDLLPLSSSLPLLTEMSLSQFTLENTESLKNLVHLSALHFRRCNGLELSFLTQENTLPRLTKLLIHNCHGLSTSSFASLSHTPNLCVLEVTSDYFDNDCLQYLENMVHLRKLDVHSRAIVGDSRLLKTLIQNLFQLEELNLEYSSGIGNQSGIAGALYSTHSRLRVLNLSYCNLVDDDLNGIGALKNTLEVLHLRGNSDLTNEALVHCKDLVKLKGLKIERAAINDLSPLKDCLSLEELDVSSCKKLADDSFKVFSEESNSFPNLRVLSVSFCRMLTEKVFEHLANNKYLVYQLKELNVRGMSEILSSATARDNICQLEGLRRIHGIVSGLLGRPSHAESEVMKELLKRLKNLEEIVEHDEWSRFFALSEALLESAHA